MKRKDQQSKNHKGNAPNDSADMEKVKDMGHNSIPEKDEESAKK